MILQHQGVRPIVGGTCDHFWEAKGMEGRCPACGGIGHVVVTDLVTLPVGTPFYKEAPEWPADEK
jgi:hypothetical protein